VTDPQSSSRGGLWARIATLVHDHPVRVFVASLAVVVLPALAVPTIRLSYDTLDELPRDAESVRSFETLADHFPPGELSPLVLVIDDDAPVTEPESMRAIGDLSRMLRRLEAVESVRSVAMPTNGERPDVQASSEQIEEFRSFDEQLAEAAEGAGQLRDGIAELDGGLARIQQRLPALAAGLDDGEDGVARLLSGLREARDGVGQLRDGAGRLQSGARELGDGLVEARDGTRRLHDDVAVPAEKAIRSAWETLFEEFSVGRSDPAYRDALQEVGEVHGRITGEDPRTGRQVEPGYDGLAPALAELADGLDDAVDGAGRLEAGTGRLASGLADLDAGLARLEDGLVQLQAGLAEAAPGVQQLMGGIDRLRDGATRLESGAAELRTGLAQGAAGVREVDLASLVPGLGGGEDGAPFMVTAGLLDALPEIRDELDLFLARDDTRTRLFVGLSTDPFANEAVASVGEILHLARVSVRESPLEDAVIEATGATALYDAVDTASDRDLPLLVAAVVLGVFAVLVLLLRAVIAPLYMVATVLLSFGSALGLTAVLFQGVLGHPGLVWWLPSFLFVLLVALGADYNIYLMSRVREEADSKPTRRAVADATQATGGVITSAGLILAGTFAALMVAEVSSLVQMGFATTVGILLDTFVVRSLLVPALATLLGRHNWWPSRRASAAAEG
jgi:putative drug exporter of the RND superfamily